MVIGLVAAASAAPVRVDVLLVPAVLQTPRFTAHHETLDVVGMPVEERRLPDRQPLGGQGLGVALMHDSREELWFFESSVHVTAPRYELRTYTFAPVSTSVRLDGGGLAWFMPNGDPPKLDGYGLLAGGLELGVLGAEPFVTAVAPAVHAMGGLGLGSRAGRVRARMEFRADLALRLDHLAGKAERPTGAFAWSWWPGQAALSLVLGVSLPREDQPVDGVED